MHLREACLVSGLHMVAGIEAAAADLARILWGLTPMSLGWEDPKHELVGEQAGVRRCCTIEP